MARSHRLQLGKLHLMWTWYQHGLLRWGVSRSNSVSHLLLAFELGKLQIIVEWM